MKCKACHKVLKLTDLKSCTHCKGDYHFLCLGISPAAYAKELKQPKKASWKCPDCKVLEKRGDNTNTPIRLQQQPESPPSTSPKSVTHPSSHFDNITMEELKSYIDNKLKEATQKILSSFRSTLTAEITSLNKTMEELRSSVAFVGSQYDQLNSTIAENAKIVDDLQKENTRLSGDLRDIKGKLAVLDQQSRACNLEIQCVPEHRSENLLTIIKHLSKTIATDITDTDIVSVHRIPKINSDSERPRNIVIKFSYPRVKDKILAAAKKFNRSHVTEKLNTSHIGIAGKKQPIYVVEHLSSENKKLHAAARNFAKEKQYEFVWVRSGRVFVRKDTKSKAHLITSESVLHS